MRLFDTVLVLLGIATSLAAALSPLPAQERCPEATRRHMTRCDRFLRCVLLPSQTAVWMTTRCRKGLVYQPSVGRCVVPDSDWECDLSSEVEPNRSEENVYGVENLAQLPPTQQANAASAPPTDGSERAHFKLPTVAGDDRLGLYIVMDQALHNYTRITGPSAAADELESSGDGGSVERPSDEVDVNAFTDNFFPFPKPSDNTKSFPAAPFDRFGSGYADKLHGGSGVRTKDRLPLPADGKIHPEHLTQIINQQKQLNRIATGVKQYQDPTGGAGDHSPFTNQPVFSRKPIVLHGAGAHVEAKVKQQSGADAIYTSNSKGPYVSEDIIRSILQISQQMIVGQNPSAVESTPDPRPPPSKPMFIPISASHIPTAPAAAEEELDIKSTSVFNAKPIGITFTNPHGLAHSMVYDNLRNPPMNGTVYFNTVPAAAPQSMGMVPPTVAGSPTTVPQHHAPAYYPSFVSAYVSPSQEGKFPHISNNAVHHYGVPDRMELQHAIEFEESGIDESSASEQASFSNENSDESAQGDLDGGVDTQLKRKLFPLGHAELDYHQYKDSILPLLDAKSDDVRISVASTCTLGSREPNKTDCFKYYVCQPHSGAFQSFTCPSFTAFNKATRLCDTATYNSCRVHQMHPPTAVRPLVVHDRSPPTKQTSNRLKNDLLTAQTYVQLIRQEADKLLTRHSLPPPVDTSIVLPAPHAVSSSVLESAKPAAKIRRKATPSGKRKTPKPPTVGTSTTTTAAAPTTKRRKVSAKVSRCRSEGRMPDPVARSSYYVCHRKSSKKYVKMKMTCPTGLVYCPATQYCTRSSACR